MASGAFSLHLRGLVPAAAACAFLTTVPAARLCAQKVDTVVIRNGDRVVGEIKSLSHGTLSYSTDDMGTLAIEWDKVDQIASPRYFEVEVSSGGRFYGTLQPGGSGRVVVAVATFSDTLARDSIVRIDPIGRNFFARLDGFINFGLTFQRANHLYQLSLETLVKHRSRQWLTQLQSSTYFQDQQDAAGTSRNSLTLSGTRFLKDRWITLVSGQIEQNEELDLDLRGLLTGGGGRFLVQTNRAYVLLGGGLTYTNERFTGTSATSNLEALLTAGAEYFHLDSPKTDLYSTLSLYPSLTDPGRVRLDLEARTSHEVIKDFAIGFTLFDKFDSRPPSAGATKNDYGVTLTLGWTF